MSKMLYKVQNLYIKITTWYKNTDFKKLLKNKIKSPIFWVQFSAYAIPFAFLLYVLYINFLPFGYSKTFIINVGNENDTNASQEFYLEPAESLSEKKVGNNGNTYRELNGMAYAIFKPNVVLKDATLKVSIEGDGVSLISPTIDFSPNNYSWDYSWDFTNKDTIKEFNGNAFLFDGATYFNGRDARLELINSKDKFEDGPFSVYVEWNPQDDQNNTQQIIGHFNWEIWQNKDNVEFRVGRMTDKDGPAYYVRYPITSDFFNKKHTLLAIYSPSDNGYIELYVDGNFAGRNYFGSEKIWKDYGDQNLSLGWTPHNYNKSPHLTGYIYKANINFKNLLQDSKSIDFKIKNMENSKVDINIVSSATSTLKNIKLYVSQR